jgi:hypothetical protein
MSKKLESLLIVHEDKLWINVNAAGYDGEGMIIATISGCPLLCPKDEKSPFISIDDAIRLNQTDLADPNIKQPEKDYRLATIARFERFKEEQKSGIHSHDNTDEWVLAYERYWDSKKGHKDRRKMINSIRKNRPDLFPGKADASKEGRPESEMELI